MIYYLVGGLLALSIGFLILKSMKLVFKLLFNTLIGGLILALFNVFGSIFGLTLQVTPLSVLTVGFLGVPGIVILLVLKYLI